ncbi:Signal transduction histidine kinase [Lactonifactor longoviformis DSM 17459]|uniref:Circadian input-output histidine kinase CikA n=2 Tax=Lactonifactor TaxID=420345 RepID=A0A1M5C535_9CLOT|nr:Signal transduction histidine kinase [Lactonifactor longoviformis DSM 17459]
MQRSGIRPMPTYNPHMGGHMRITKKTKTIITFFLLLLILLGSVQRNTLSVQAEAAVPEKKVIKVAFPYIKGLSETDEKGNHQGLVVDYLNEIAKYTNWEYEYITGESEALITDFMNGEYDLLGGTFYSPDLETYFSYPDYTMGSNRAVLFCRKDNLDLRTYDLSTLNGKTIGVYEKADEKIRRLQEFLNFNGLECQLKYYKQKDMMNDTLYHHLENGEVDLLLGNDLEDIQNFRVIATFEAQPYYISVAHGEQEIMDELNMALRHILEGDPDFAEKHYALHFPEQRTADIQYDPEEVEYIKNAGKIRVAAVKDWHPYFCIDGDKQHHNGIIPDVLDEISESSGLEFTYCFADTYTDAIQMVQEGNADILGWFLDAEDAAREQGLALTKPFISMNNMIVKNNSVSYPSGNLTGAVLEGRVLPDDVQAENMVYYATTEASVKAVNQGEADFVYGLATSLETELQKPSYRNITPVTFYNTSTPVSFAMVRPVDPELLSILNKGISDIQEEEMDAITGRNFVSGSYVPVTLKELIYENPMAAVLIVAAFLLLILLIVVLIARSRVKSTVLQAELRRAEAESKAKGDFLSRMSHEIRTPMNAIAGLVDLTCMKEGLSGEVKGNLEKIRSSTKYLLALLNDILDMSRLDGGMLTIASEPFSLEHLLSEAEEMTRIQTQQKNQEFIFQTDITHSRVTGDPIRLRQVLTNLLSNAGKFTPPRGSITLKVKEEAFENGRAVYRFSVTDTGDGIAPEFQKQIFGVFEQLGTSSSKSEGTGLGLPISQNIVKLMGGELEVNSTPKKGTEFFFTLSLPVEAPEETNNPQKEPVSQEAFRGKRILLAEDNDLNAEIAEELLKMKGIRSERACDGQEAVFMFESHSAGYYDLILMDLQMPVKNGLEAAREIRSSPLSGGSTVPILAMTANTFQEDMDAAAKAGMNGFITKPVDSNYMYEILSEYL